MATKILWLPAAERIPHPRWNGWTETSDPKGCLHTTEGGSWPVYEGWTIMPHATVLPTAGKGVVIRQHLPFNQGSFALRNLSGGVQTNRDYVFQFELVGTCDKHGDAYKAGAYYWPEADDAVLEDLYEKVIAPLSEAYGIPLKARPFQAYPASYGARGVSNTVRLSGSDFDNYSGWLGHQHVPENIHGDPGAFPWARMMETQMALTEAQTIEAAKQGVLAAWKEKVIENLPVHPGDPQGGNWDWLGWAAAQDRKQDLQNENLGKIATAVTALAAGQAELKTLITAAGGNPGAIDAAMTAGLAKITALFDSLQAHITIDTPKGPTS